MGESAATRFLDKKEMDARSKELRAAAAAGIPQDELEFFRVARCGVVAAAV